MCYSPLHPPIHSLVPPQTPEDITDKVTAYIEAEFAKLNTKNTLKVEFLHGGRAWVADINHWNFEAARRATEVRVMGSPHASFDGTCGNL